MDQPKNLLAESEPFSLEISIPDSSFDYRDVILADAKSVPVVKYQPGGKNETQFHLLVNANRSLGELIKAVEKTEDELRKPVNAKLKEIRALRDEFLGPIRAEQIRLTNIQDDYRRAELNAQREEEKRLAEEQRKAQQARDDAARKIREEEERIARQEAALRQADLSKKLRAQAEKELAKAKAEKEAAEMAQEEAEMAEQSVEKALSTPTNTPQGLSTRVRFDFTLSKPLAMTNNHPDLWTWDAQNEVLKFKRAEMLKNLNSNGESFWTDMLPPDGQEAIIHAALGLKIFRDVRTSTR